MVAQYNIKVKDGRLELTDDQLYSQHWVCKHFGNFKSRSEKNARLRGFYNQGCEFFIYMAW